MCIMNFGFYLECVDIVLMPNESRYDVLYSRIHSGQGEWKENMNTPICKGGTVLQDWWCKSNWSQIICTEEVNASFKQLRELLNKQIHLKRLRCWRKMLTVIIRANSRHFVKRMVARPPNTSVILTLFMFWNTSAWQFDARSVIKGGQLSKKQTMLPRNESRLSPSHTRRQERSGLCDQTCRFSPYERKHESSSYPRIFL